MKSVVILISGRGSNMASLLAAAASGALPVRIVGVLSNRADAQGLQTAAAHGVPTRVLEHRLYAEREAFDAALAEAIDRLAPDLSYWQASCASWATGSCAATKVD
jgi:phosphoribosylglycinamide formyltransferase-1